jgi:hypothetical protein
MGGFVRLLQSDHVRLTVALRCATLFLLSVVCIKSVEGATFA